MAHISVMIPVYNRESLIQSTLDCILAQSYCDFDITVVDDASIDNTVRVVENYGADERIRLIRNEENLGLTRNWNRCLELAKGPLVQIMQSDDLMDMDYLERANRIFEENPDVGFLSANCRYIDGRGKVIGTYPDKPDCMYRAGDEAVTAILTIGFPHVSSIIMQKSVLEKIGKFNEGIWHGPDVEFDARMASRFSYYIIGKVCTSFRRHGTNRGNLEYMRKDFLSNHIWKMKLAWGYLSDHGRKTLGIRNLTTFVNYNAAQTAIGGAIVMVAYGKNDMGRYYLKKAIELNPGSILIFRFWKAFGLNLYPRLGQKLMERRLNISKQDMNTINGSKLQ